MVNKVILLGRLGQDPELKQTPQGSPYCNFSVATSESWTDKKSGQKQEKTEWHRITVWGTLAKNVSQFCKKGSQVFIEGKMHTRSYDDNNGGKHYSTGVSASSVQFLSAPSSEGAKNANQAPPQEKVTQSNRNNSQYYDSSDDNSKYGGTDFSKPVPDSHYTSDTIPF